MNLPAVILDRSIKDENAFLRNRTVPFVFSEFSKKEIQEMVRHMRKVMKAANGIGLAANQIGLPWRVFVAEVEGDRGSKFYAVFNPILEKVEKDVVTMEEGCLSVPGTWGDVDRPAKVLLSGQDMNGRAIKIKAWGLLARVFQHEVDHLDGKLFIDRTKKLYKVQA